ncbi:transposase [Mesorhizobium sp.]|uniref:transposase n=1 Tax=Mesorhizobium sp. TaxID=1871066 RepID=UPI0033903FD9
MGADRALHARGKGDGTTAHDRVGGRSWTHSSTSLGQAVAGIAASQAPYHHRHRGASGKWTILPTQDRDGAVRVIASISTALSVAAPSVRRRRLRRRNTDTGPCRPRHVDHRKHLALRRGQGFEVLPRRWVVERTFAWLGRCPRLAKDFEATIASAGAWIFIASIRLMLRRRAPSRRA